MAYSSIFLPAPVLRYVLGAIDTDACSVSVENGEIVVKNCVGDMIVYNTIGIAVATAFADGNDVRIAGLQCGLYIVTIADMAVKVIL